MKKATNIALKSLLAGALVFGVNVGYGQAEGNDTAETVSTDTPTSTTAETDTTTEGTSSDSEVSTSDNEVLPGEFLYLFKIIFENIQLSIEENDIEKAKLLVQFGEERVDEIQALMKQGQMELAQKMIESALNNQMIELEIQDLQDEMKEEETEEAANEDASNEENSDEVTEEATEEATEEENEETNEATEEDVKEIEEYVARNIVALKAVAAKVKNPNAKAAIERNIKKAEEKWEKKLAKWGFEVDIIIEITEKETDTVESEEATEANSDDQAGDNNTVETNTTSPIVVIKAEISEKQDYKYNGNGKSHKKGYEKKYSKYDSDKHSNGKNNKGKNGK